MLKFRPLYCIALAVCLAAFAAAAAADVAPAVTDAGHAQRRPTRFAIIFNMGYAGDHLPKDKDDFEKLVLACKEAHYNVLLCKYEDWRADICRKHDMQMMVDLLVAENHVFRNVEGAKKLCESLRGNDAVYGYHLWSDNMPVPGRNRDIANVHQWDPTHPTYVGSYKMHGNSGLVNPDLHGYYDFHWQRGGHWAHLQSAWQVSRAKDAFFLSYLASNPGAVGRGNVNRLDYTNSTAIAFGIKGFLYHFIPGTLDTKTWKWGPVGQDLAKANAEVAPLGPELIKLGNPVAIYSTPATKDENNRARAATDPPVPPPFQAVPATFFAAVTAGEAVLGVFKDPQGRDAVVLANRNAYLPQQMKLHLRTPGGSIEIFDRKTAQWEKLAANDNVVSFELIPGGFQLIRHVQ